MPRSRSEVSIMYYSPSFRAALSLARILPLFSVDAPCAPRMPIHTFSATESVLLAARPLRSTRDVVRPLSEWYVYCISPHISSLSVRSLDKFFLCLRTFSFSCFCLCGSVTTCRSTRRGLFDTIPSNHPHRHSQLWPPIIRGGGHKARDDHRL